MNSLYRLMAPSSSGLGHLVFIQKIAGSSPAGVTEYDYSQRIEINFGTKV